MRRWLFTNLYKLQMFLGSNVWNMLFLWLVSVLCDIMYWNFLDLSHIDNRKYWHWDIFINYKMSVNIEKTFHRDQSDSFNSNSSKSSRGSKDANARSSSSHQAFSNENLKPLIIPSWDLKVQHSPLKSISKKDSFPHKRGGTHASPSQETLKEAFQTDNYMT